MKKAPLIAVLMMLAATLLPIPAASAAEMRALWVDAWGAGFLNADQVQKLVSDARDHNFNAIFVHMRRRGDAFYMPQAPNQDPRTTVLASDYDALAEIIQQAHSGTPRIQVHCWVVTNLIWGNETVPPSQPEHVFNQHPEYLMKNRLGDTFMAEGYYLDPGNPGAMQWNHNMATDIVSRYDIDGFHWDYIRYPQQDSGYNDVAVARYNEEFGLTGLPDVSDPQFSQWRRRQVTDFVRWVNADLLAIKPSLIVSAAVFANRSDAFTYRFQDWSAWNNEGIIDLCLPMNYASANSTFNSRVDDIFNHQGIRLAYVGQGAYLNTKENTVTQLNYVRDKGMWGTALYSYRTPNSGTVDQAATFGYIRDNYQPTWQEVPLLPWKVNPEHGIIKGAVKAADTGEIIYNADVSLDPGATQRTTAHGSFAFFDTDPGTRTITVSASGYASSSQTTTLSAGDVLHLDFLLEPGSAGPVEDIIIDNPQATVSGSWSSGTAAAGKYGDDYRWKGQGTGSAYLQYTPAIQTAGNYDVFTWYPAGSNRTVGAPHMITHAGGSDFVYVDQQVNGGQWNHLGTYSFAAGNSGHVRITDGFGDAGQVVVADAVAFVYAGEAPQVTAVHVDSVSMSWVAVGGKRARANAVVTVVDAQGTPIEGATITGDFSGALTEPGATGTTNASGTASISSEGSVNRGTVTFTVSDISGSGVIYDSGANNQTSASISR